MFVLPNIFNIKPYVVTSGSMEPIYKVGSLIYVKDVNIDEIKIGDSITFYMTNSDIVATHQVYDIDYENNLFKTHGINNKDSEGNIIKDANPVKFSDVIGKPIFTIPYLGFLNRIVTKSPGNYIIILITIIIFGISFVLDTKNKKEKE